MSAKCSIVMECSSKESDSNKYFFAISGMVCLKVYAALVKNVDFSFLFRKREYGIALFMYIAALS